MAPKKKRKASRRGKGDVTKRRNTDRMVNFQMQKSPDMVDVKAVLVATLKCEFLTRQSTRASLSTRLFGTSRSQITIILNGVARTFPKIAIYNFASPGASLIINWVSVGLDLVII